MFIVCLFLVFIKVWVLDKVSNWTCAVIYRCKIHISHVFQDVLWSYAKGIQERVILYMADVNPSILRTFYTHQSYDLDQSLKDTTAVLNLILTKLN